MNLFSGTCTICLQLGKIMKLSEKIPNRHFSIKLFLRNFVPEVEWLDDYTICEKCVRKLLMASDFRELCLKIKDGFIKQEHFSQNIGESVKLEIEPEFEFKDLNSENNDVKCSEDFDDFLSDDNEYSKFENGISACDIFICYYCNNEFKTKDELVLHIQTEHKVGSSSFKYKRTESCKKCGRRYVSLLKLNAHTLVCDGITRHCKSKGNFQCDICLKYYTTLKILKAHKLKCKPDNLVRTNFQCLKCNKFYKNDKILKAHELSGCKQEVITSELTCKICSENVETSLQMQEHLFQVHSSKLYCQICNRMFHTTRDFITHKQEVHKKNKFQECFTCELCGDKFTFLRNIMDHYVKTHSLDKKSAKPYSCDVCEKRFRKSSNLIRHHLYHDGNRTNMCSFCGKSFITKNDLTAHEHIHYKFRKYKCTKCDKAFKTNTTLRSHYLIVHTDPALWKYVCVVCNKRFPQKSNHDQHLRRHLGQKNFECPVCKKMFASKSEVQDHVMWHSNKKAFRCEYCDKEYRKRYTYNVHLTKIHGIGNANIKIPERKFSCHICPGKFSDKSKLTRHLCTHSGVKPYACSICEKKFIDKSYLKHHVKIAHNNEYVGLL